MLTQPQNDEAEARPKSLAGRLASAAVPLAAAVQFLTIAPPLIRRPFTAAEMGRAVGWFPVVGVLLGGTLVLTDELLALLFPPLLARALLLATWVLFTGAIHLDGFMDTCDGLFGGRTPEERLQIMRDEHVGAYAVIGVVLLLLVKYVALASLAGNSKMFWLSPVVGRTALVLAIVAFPYARPDGLGRAMKDHAGMQEASMGLSFIVIPWLAIGWVGLVALAIAGIFTLLAGWLAQRRLGGLTGDVYGSVCELVEVLTLLILR